jgi:hypothetical protein
VPVQATQLRVSAPPRVAARLRAAADRPLHIVHAGPDAVYVDLDGWCLGVVSTDATQVPCALRTRLDTLPEVRSAHVGSGVLHLDGTPLRVGRICSVAAPRIEAGVVPRGFDVTAMVGAGDGLTPYGDDVLCGWLALHRAAGVETPDVDAEIRSLMSRTTLLSATLLDCAMRGEVLPEFAAYVATIGTSREADAARTLAAVGGSSGAGLLEGARWALAA